MGLTFQVSPDVLIPNPDTETLVEAALEVAKAVAEAVAEPVEAVEAPHEGLRILDLCTGSGCVGLSFLHYCKSATLVATDISEAALAVAKKNADTLGLSDRADFVCCDLFPKEAPFHLILTNPPYIRTDVIDTLEPEVASHEPRLALDGGADGLTFYRRILERIDDFLAPGGWLLTEIGYDEGKAVKALFEAAGLQEVCVLKDLAGLDRVVKGRL